MSDRTKLPPTIGVMVPSPVSAALASQGRIPDHLWSFKQFPTRHLASA